MTESIPFLPKMRSLPQDFQILLLHFSRPCQPAQKLGCTLRAFSSQIGVACPMVVDYPSAPRPESRVIVHRDELIRMEAGYESDMEVR